MPNLEWFADVARQRVTRARSIIDVLCVIGDELRYATNPDTPEKALEAARDELLAVEEALRLDRIARQQSAKISETTK